MAFKPTCLPALPTYHRLRNSSCFVLARACGTVPGVFACGFAFAHQAPLLPPFSSHLPTSLAARAPFHQPPPSPRSMTRLFLSTYAAQRFGPACVTLPRLSLLLTYAHLSTFPLSGMTSLPAAGDRAPRGYLHRFLPVANAMLACLWACGVAAAYGHAPSSTLAVRVLPRCCRAERVNTGELLCCLPSRKPDSLPSLRRASVLTFSALHQT